MSDFKPPLTYQEASEVVAETATAPRVTKESIEAKIAAVDYLRHGLTTIAVLTLKSGFKVIGHSTPAHEDNFNATVGESFAFDNAFKQLWPLEGYLLRNRLAQVQQ